MERFVHNENMALYKKLIAESERNPKRDEDRHNMLLTLLAKEWLRTHERAAEAVAAETGSLGPARCQFPLMPMQRPYHGDSDHHRLFRRTCISRSCAGRAQWLGLAFELF